MIVVDIAPRAYEPYHRPLINALLQLELKEYRSFDQIHEALTEEIPDDPLRQFLLKNLTRGHDGEIVWRSNLAAIAASDESLANAIEITAPILSPACFIRASWSNYIKDSDCQTIRELFPNAEIIKLPETTHWVHADAPERFVQTVEAFLNRR